jgi:hypothetical protein
MCQQYRIVLMGIPSSMTASDRKGLILHEFYHAFQQDLGDESCVTKRDSSTNGGWIVEGAAEYFSLMESNGATLGPSAILKSGVEAYQEDSDTSIKGSGVSSRGAAGLRLMVERTWLTESDILDGTLFHSCISETDYTDANNNVVQTKSLWYKIEQSNGVYSFTSEAVPL